MGRITVTKVMETETAHRLMNYDGKCAHIHGHSYRWEVTVESSDGVDPVTGITADFGYLKGLMKKWIFDVFDHALVLWQDDPLLGTPAIHRAANGQPQKIVEFANNPTAENFARWVYGNIQHHFDNLPTPPHLTVVKVVVWETSNSHAEWRGYQD